MSSRNSRLYASEHLLAIEQLEGLTPGEKFRHLYKLALLISGDVNHLAHVMLDGNVTEDVAKPLIPLLQVIIAKNDLMDNHIVYALRNSDPSIWKQALKARWFFKLTNRLIEPIYLVEKVFPSATIELRTKVIKKIAKVMYGYPRNAERGFELFRNTYGLEQALPMFVSCGPNYTFDLIRREKIIFSVRMLNFLFPWQPDLVLSYLLMGTRVDSNYNISLDKYTEFLPKIITYFPMEFIMLYQHLKNPKIRLSNNKTKHLLGLGKPYVIKEPQTFLKMLPLELITKKFRMEEFEEMFRNFFPKNPAEFNITEVAAVLTYLPQETKLNMLLNAYEKVYQDTLFNNVKHFFSPTLYQLFPSHEAKTNFLTMTFTPVGKTNVSDKTPPHILLEYVLKEVKEFENSNKDVIGKYIEPLIKSCALFNDQVILYKVLELLYDRQKDDGKSCLNALEVIGQEFDLSKLTRKPWKKIADLLLWEDKYLKFIEVVDTKYGPVLRGLVHHLLSLDFKDKTINDYKNIDDFLEISIRCFLKYKMTSLFVDDVSDKRVTVERIDSFINRIRRMYASSNPFWTDTHEKLRFVLSILKNIHEFNVKHGYTTKKLSRSKKPIEGKLVYNSYPWFKTTAFDLLKQEPFNLDTRRLLLELRDIIRLHDPEGYYEDLDILHDVGSVDALHALQRGHLKFGLHLESYAESCAIAYPRSKHFLKRIRWYGRLGSRIFLYVKNKLFNTECCATIAHISNEPYYDTLVDWWYNRTDENRVSNEVILKAASDVYPPVSLKIFCNYMKKYQSMRPLIRDLLIKVAKKWNYTDLVKNIFEFLQDEEFLKDEGARFISIVGTKRDIAEYAYWIKTIQEISESGVQEKHRIAREHDYAIRGSI